MIRFSDMKRGILITTCMMMFLIFSGLMPAKNYPAIELSKEENYIYKFVDSEKLSADYVKYKENLEYNNSHIVTVCKVISADKDDVVGECTTISGICEIKMKDTDVYPSVGSYIKVYGKVKATSKQLSIDVDKAYLEKDSKEGYSYSNKKTYASNT